MCSSKMSFIGSHVRAHFRVLIKGPRSSLYVVDRSTLERKCDLKSQFVEILVKEDSGFMSLSLSLESRLTLVFQSIQIVGEVGIIYDSINKSHNSSYIMQSLQFCHDHRLRIIYIGI